MKQRGGWSSAWPERLAICSAAIPLVIVFALYRGAHWPFIADRQRYEDDYMMRVAERAWPLDGCVTAMVIAAAAVWVVARKHGLRAWGAPLVVGAAFAGGVAATIPLWVVVEIWNRWLEAHSGVWENVLCQSEAVIVYAVLASLGVFHLVGLPCLAVRRLRNSEWLGRRRFAIWVMASVAVWVVVFGLWTDRYPPVGGVGGFETLVIGTMFTWGAGLAAHAAARALRARRRTAQG